MYVHAIFAVVLLHLLCATSSSASSTLRPHCPAGFTPFAGGCYMVSRARAANAAAARAHCAQFNARVLGAAVAGGRHYYRHHWQRRLTDFLVRLAAGNADDDGEPVTHVLVDDASYT